MYRESKKAEYSKCYNKQKRKSEEIEEREEVRKTKKSAYEYANSNPAEVVNIASGEMKREMKKEFDDMKAELKAENAKNHADTDAKLEEMKGMMKEICAKPQLVMICNSLYPFESLKDLNLKDPCFGSVREILDKELPEYANLCNRRTGKVHCKAIKELNTIQPTAIRDNDNIYIKQGDILSKEKDNDVSRAFINVIADNGYEYAKNARDDLRTNFRPAYDDWKKSILVNAREDAFPSIQEVN